MATEKIKRNAIDSAKRVIVVSKTLGEAKLLHGRLAEEIRIKSHQGLRKRFRILPATENGLADDVRDWKPDFIILDKSLSETFKKIVIFDAPKTTTVFWLGEEKWNNIIKLIT